MIKRLEQAGLGYHIQADATADKLGSKPHFKLHTCKLYSVLPDIEQLIGITIASHSGQLPMRRLVYRVQALPQSMLPLVWDFGQLDLNTEKQYIEEMVNKCVRHNDMSKHLYMFVDFFGLSFCDSGLRLGWVSDCWSWWRRQRHATAAAKPADDVKQHPGAPARLHAQTGGTQHRFMT